MNIDNARENLPLKKLTFTKYGEFRYDDAGEKNWFKSWNVKLDVCRGGDCAEDFKEFAPGVELDTNGEEHALAAAMALTTGEAGPVDMKSELPVCPHDGDLILMQLTITEYVYGRDTGCEWSDPENDIRRKARIEYWIKQGWGGDIVEFTGGASRLSTWAVAEAYRNAIRVMESCFPSEKEQKNIVGFEWNDRVYGNPRFRNDDPSVLGDPIDGRTLTPLPFPGDGRDRGDGADVNYLHDYVSWHYRNHIYIVGGNFYLNGEFILSVEELIWEVVYDPDKMGDHDLYMMKSAICENSFFRQGMALQWLSKTFPEAGYVVGDHGHFSMTLNDDNRGCVKEGD